MGSNCTRQRCAFPSQYVPIESTKVALSPQIGQRGTYSSSCISESSSALTSPSLPVVSPITVLPVNRFPCPPQQGAGSDSQRSAPGTFPEPSNPMKGVWRNPDLGAALDKFRRSLCRPATGSHAVSFRRNLRNGLDASSCASSAVVGIWGRVSWFRVGSLPTSSILAFSFRHSSRCSSVPRKATCSAVGGW